MANIQMKVTTKEIQDLAEKAYEYEVAMRYNEAASNTELARLGLRISRSVLRLLNDYPELLEDSVSDRGTPDQRPIPDYTDPFTPRSGQ